MQLLGIGDNKEIKHRKSFIVIKSLLTLPSKKYCSVIIL